MHEWQPADQVESDMAEALRQGDSKRYAQLVLDATLYVPRLPDRDSPEWWQMMRALPLEREHVFVFTSPQSMRLVLGEYARGHATTTFASLARQWRNPQWLLAINPGLPIGVFLPPAALPALASGEESLTPIADVQAATEEAMEAEIRRVCLEGLGGGDRPAYAANPVNRLEAELANAVTRQDGEAFLEALVGGQVVVPTTLSVPDPGELSDEDFPWHRVGENLPVVPAFSSAAVLDHVCPDGLPRVVVPFLTLVAGWPDETHVLCFNPGTSTELILFGDTMLELLAAAAESLVDTGMDDSGTLSGP